MPHAGTDPSHGADAQMYAGALCRIQAQSVLAIARPPRKSTPTKGDLESAETTETKLVPDIAPGRWKEMWIVTHDGNLARCMSAMPNIRGFPGTGQEVRRC